MKLFPTNWEGFLEDVSLWGQLSIPARRVFLDGARPGLTIESSGEDPAIGELWGSGFLSDTGRSGYYSVNPRFSGFHRLAKALEKSRIFETPGFDVLREYLSEHFTRVERALLHESFAFHSDDYGRMAGIITTVEWLEEFLKRDRIGPHGQAYRGVAEMLRFFMDQRDHVPIRDLEDYFPSADRIAIALSLKLGVQSAVFFLSLRGSDLEPLVGIWPSAARRLRRAQIALPPQPVTPRMIFRHPFLVDDMTTLLLDANVEPIPVRRADEKPFSRFEEDRAAALLSLPAWLEELTGATPRIRVGSALTALRLAGFLVSVQEGDTIRLHPASGSMEWALSGLHERLTEFLHRSAAGRQSPLKGAAVLLSLLLGTRPSWADAAEELLPAMAQAFSSVPRSSFIRFTDFARFQSAIANPLIPLRERGEGTSLWAGISSLPTDELLEELWQSFLHAYLSFGLLGVGGIEAGFADGDRFCFRLTPTGRSLLEASGGPVEVEEPAAAAPLDIVVQPTFEVAFLSPSPAMEAEIGRFAERRGREVGVLFRVTKESILRAAAAGLSEERVLASLSKCSRNPIPQNVEHEIRGWFRSAAL
jgi:hypothetical protein